MEMFHFDRKSGSYKFCFLFEAHNFWVAIVMRS